MVRLPLVRLFVVAIFLTGLLAACGDSSTPAPNPTATVPAVAATPTAIPFTPTLAPTPIINTPTLSADQNLGTAHALYASYTAAAYSRATLAASLATPTPTATPTLDPTFVANMTAEAIRNQTPTATPTPVPTPTPVLPTPTPTYGGIVLVVTGTKGIKFSGSCLVFKADGSSASQDAVGTVPVNFKLGGGDIVSCVLQKQGVNGQLNAKLLDGEVGPTIAEGSTSQQYGVVSVSGKT